METLKGLSIYKKKGTRFWWMRVKVGPWKVEKSTKMLDKNAAYQLAKQVHDKLMVQYTNMQLGVSTPMDNPNMTLSEATDFVYKHKWSKNKSSIYAAAQMQRIIKILGDIPIRGINADVVRMLRTRLEKWPVGNTDDGKIHFISPSTVNTYLTNLRTIMRYLNLNVTAYSDMPVPAFPMATLHNARERIITEREENTLFDLMKNRHPHYRDLFIVLIDTGMRVGEALNLTYKDNISSDCGTIQLFSRQTKGKSARSLPVPMRSKEILLRRRKESPFKPFHSTNIPSVQHASIVFRSYRDMMGLKDDKEFVPHALRHTCCTRLLEAGIPMELVQMWMGHSTIKMTQRYSHLTHKALEGAAKSIDERNQRNANEWAEEKRRRFTVV